MVRKTKNLSMNTTGLGYPITKNTFNLIEREHKKIDIYINDVIDNTFNPMLNSTSSEISNMNLNITNVISNAQILNNYPTLNNITTKSINVIQKSQHIAGELDTKTQQLDAVTELQRIEQEHTGQGNDFVSNIIIETDVKVNVSEAAVLYQQYFGYPEDGVWDTEKLQLIMNALQQQTT